MKQNEDGFYSVEDCVAALTKPPKYTVGVSSNVSSECLDMRRRGVKQLYRVLKNTKHVAHVPFFGRKFQPKVLFSFLAKQCLDCEDFDALIDTLNTINQLNQ
jgi:hypothetical protein